MTTTFVTRTADRWDLLAQDIYNLSSLGWAIAEANPLLAGVLILDGGITINIPAIETLRQPLVSVNPARADVSTGFITPPGTASPTPPPTPTPSAVVFPIAISQGGTGAINNSQALTNLGAIATNQIGVTVAPLVSGLVPAANLPAYPTLSSLGAIPTSAIGVTVAPLTSGVVPTANLPAYPTLSSLGAIPTSAIGTTVAPLASGLVPTANLPAYPTLSSLDAIPTSAIGVTVAPIVSGLVPTANLPAYPTLSSLGAIPTSAIGVTVARLTSGVVPIANLPAYPTLSSLGAIPTSAIGTTVAPLTSGVVPTANLPAYPTLSSLGAIPTSAIGTTVAPLVSGLVPTANLPAYPTLSSLGAIPTSAIGVTVAPLASGLIPTANLPLSTFFPFTGGAGFKGGGSPGLATNTQAGVDSSGFPRFWLVNGSAPVNSRIKSITVAVNGNLQFRHHNDDLSDGNVLEHTASGNTLTNGTFRPGSGATAFTGASFVPGAIYFRTDVLGDSGAGCSTYSDGTIWRRTSNGSPVTVADAPVILEKIITGTTASTQGGSVSVAHGVTGSKIRNINGVIFYTATGTVPLNSRQANYSNVFGTDATNLLLVVDAGNSSSILSKTFYAVIQYTE